MKNQTNDIIRSIKPPPGGFAVLAVDFEFHQEFSYDGFIYVASVSSPETTLVVDCIHENRLYAINWMKKMLTGKRVLKAFCGCANDIFRMQKDWDCFPSGIVDVQDMFVVWRRKFFKDCFNECRRAVERRLEERKKRSNETDVEEFLMSLNTPGLAFLMDIFFANSVANKDATSTFADWRKRPLHNDLLRYSACDSYFTLKVFNILHTKIGHTGVQEAAEMAIAKLLNRSSLPRYKDNIISNVDGQWFVEQILSWRQYLALNFDMKPNQILNSTKIPLLARDLQSTDGTDVHSLSVFLEKYKTNDNYEKGARLLSAYLEKDGETLNTMKSLRCHNCRNIGHTAKFCFTDPQPGYYKAFMSLPESRQFKLNQDARRRKKYCEKHGLDPEKTVCPWEARQKK